jgi:hypothetical protein
VDLGTAFLDNVSGADVVEPRHLLYRRGVAGGRLSKAALMKILGV